MATRPMRANRMAILSIYGPAGAGKSQLAKAVAERLGSDRCARVPADYYLLPTGVQPAIGFREPLRYDWALLRRLLDLPKGTATSTPDFDFERLRRVAV